MISPPRRLLVNLKLDPRMPSWRRSDVDSLSSLSDSTCSSNHSKRDDGDEGGDGDGDQKRLPSEGVELSPREVYSILSKFEDMQKSLLIKHWIEDRRIPISRQKVYRFLKKCQDEGYTIPKTWNGIGESVTRSNDKRSCNMNDSTHKVLQDLQV
jgi:hypothetical protein